MAKDLTPSQLVVLGLIARHGPMTPYELKARVESSVGHYWPIPHAQLYRDPPRLADLGLLREDAEEHGRRRRVFHLTAAGRETLRSWLADPSTPEPETRNPALLKLTFADLGAPGQVAELAEAQAAQHRRWLGTYREMQAHLDPHAPDTPARTRLLTLGIAHEQSYVTFWESLAADPNGTGAPGPEAAA
ncbi:PadR family transcriptional regulator [Streptomyces sp. TLI_235]|nr:PadR family transcriptional regulator [Streptomyces sp. TLI_235]PBC66187.1 PadR family transcriptional regulator [Streptomyces sp. TLI_235]